MKTVMLAVVVNGNNKPMIVQALWNAVKHTAGSLHHIKAQNHSEQTELYKSAEAAEAEHLALLLLGVLLPILHQTAALADVRIRHSLPNAFRQPHGKQQMHCHAAAHLGGAHGWGNLFICCSLLVRVCSLVQPGRSCCHDAILLKL